MTDLSIFFSAYTKKQPSSCLTVLGLVLDCWSILSWDFYQHLDKPLKASVKTGIMGSHWQDSARSASSFLSFIESSMYSCSILLIILPKQGVYLWFFEDGLKLYCFSSFARAISIAAFLFSSTSSATNSQDQNLEELSPLQPMYEKNTSFEYFRYPCILLGNWPAFLRQWTHDQLCQLSSCFKADRHGKVPTLFATSGSWSPQETTLTSELLEKLAIVE